MKPKKPALTGWLFFAPHFPFKLFDLLYENYVVYSPA
jgi:hypothetical protein